MIEELMNNATLMALVLAPITTGMIEVVKRTANIQERYLPLVSLLSGVAIAVLIALGTGQDIVQYILVGVIGGLSSAGLYDQKKITE